MSSSTDDQTPRQSIDLVVVLGMHRSGTSALTRGLAALDVDLGQHLIPGIEGDNAKGYFEDAEIHYVCDKVLESFGHSWSSLAPLGDADFARLAQGELMDTAIRVMQARVGAGKIYGLKNPRISAILPFWKMVFQRMNLAVGYVVVVRNPLSVASSMIRSALDRDVSFEKSHLLWLTHVSSSMALTADDPRVVVDFDLLLANPEGQLQRLADGLGLPAPTAGQLQDYAGAFLQEGLRHSVFSPEDLAHTEGVPEEVVEAYRLARAEAASSPPIKDAVGQAFFIRLWHQLFLVKFVLSYLDRRETHFAIANSIATAAAAAAGGSPPALGTVQQTDPNQSLSHALTQGLRSHFEQAQRAQQNADARHGARLLHLGREIQGVLDRLAILGRLEDGLGRLGASMSFCESGLNEITAALRSDSAQQLAAVQALHEEAARQASMLGSGMNAQFEQMLDHMRQSRLLAEQQAKDAAKRTSLQATALEQRLIASAEQTSRAHETSVDGATAKIGALLASQTEGLHARLSTRIARLADASALELAREAIVGGIGDLGTSLGGQFSRELAAVSDELGRASTRQEQLVAQQREHADARLAELAHGHELAIKDLRTEHTLALDLERERSAELLRQSEVAANEHHRIFADALARVAELAQRHELRLDAARTEHAQAFENERQRAIALLRQAEAGTSELRRLSADRLAELEKRHQQALQELRGAHSTALDNEQRRSSALLAQRDEALARAQDDFGRQLDALRLQFETSQAAMASRVGEQQAAFDARLLDFKDQLAQKSAAHALAVQALREHQAEMVKDHDSLVREQAEQSARQTELITRSHASELASVKEMAAAEARRISEDRDRRVQELQTQAERVHHADQARILELEQTLESMRTWRGMGLLRWWNQGPGGGQ